MGQILCYIGGNGPRALFLGVFLGLALPDLAGLLRPILPLAVATLLLFALLRVDWSIMAAYLRQPLRCGLLVSWMLLVSPVIAWLAVALLPLPDALKTSIVLMACAPPILGATAIAMLLGLDGALVVVIGIVCTLLAPMTVPPLALALLGLDLQVGVAELMLRLAALVLGAFLAALLLRRLVGLAKIRSYHRQLDGLMVLTMLIFAISVMEGVTAAALDRPGMVTLWLAAAFVANPILQLLGWLAFSWMGRRRALSAALMSGNCNMGLLLAALPQNTDFAVVLFFAIAQLPMYMLPALIAPIYRRLLPSPETPS